ncbi:hypothetical protein LAWI1_G007987, partial [Lachnellula willkommii]
QSPIQKNPANNESENAPAAAEEEDEGAEDDNVLFFAPDPPETEHTANIFSPPVRGRRDTDLSSVRERSASPPPGFWARLKKEPVVVLPETQDVKCVVSSGHMMLASAYFQKRLTGEECVDAGTLRRTGRATIALGDDPDTFAILLNIIHGRTRQVPRQVSLDLLSKLAVLINYYAMLESVELFSDTWIENLKREGMPTEYNEHVLPWLFIFWVFEKGDDFRDMARLVQRECDERLDELVGAIPLPHTMIKAMKNGRRIAIDTAISAIDQLITKYMDGKVNCTHDGESLRYSCDAMVLGSLMKGARTIGIWPKPTAPFPGKILRKLLEEIRSIKVLDVCSQQVDASGIRYPASNCHGIEDSIKATMKIIEDGLDDLELDDYKKDSEKLWDEFPTNIPAPVEEVKEPSIVMPQVVEETALEIHEEPEPKSFEIDEDIEDLVKEFSSEVKVERWFSNDSFKSLPLDDVSARISEKDHMADDTKENSAWDSYSNRRDSQSKAFDREVRREEVKEDQAVHQATYRKDITTDSFEPRPVLVELKLGQQGEQVASSPNSKNTRTDFHECRPQPVEAKESRPVEHGSTSPYRRESKPEPIDRRSPVVVDSRKSPERSPQMPYRNGATIESPRQGPIVDEQAKRDATMDQVIQQSRESTPRREVRPDHSVRSPVREKKEDDPTIAQLLKSPPLPPPRTNLKQDIPDRRSPATEDAKRNYPVVSPHRRDDPDSPRRREGPEQPRHTPPQTRTPPSPSANTIVRQDLFRRSPVHEAARDRHTPSPAPNGLHRDVHIPTSTSTATSATKSDLEEHRRSPVAVPVSAPVPVASKHVHIYPFAQEQEQEQDVNEIDAGIEVPATEGEGVKVTDNWRGSLIPTLEDAKTKIKTGLKARSEDVNGNGNGKQGIAKDDRVSANGNANGNANGLANGNGEDNDLFIPPTTF